MDTSIKRNLIGSKLATFVVFVAADLGSRNRLSKHVMMSYTAGAQQAAQISILGKDFAVFVAVDLGSRNDLSTHSVASCTAGRKQVVQMNFQKHLLRLGGFEYFPSKSRPRPFQHIH